MRNIILIIGASSDIGINLIMNLEEECLVIAHYNTSNEKLLQLEGRISNKLETVKANLASEDEIENLLNKIESDYGVPNKIIHIAASKLENIRFKDVVWEDFEKGINISFKSLVIILKRFLPKLAKEKGGNVVVILSSSIFGVPPKFLSHYTTIKYALLGLVKSLASEYADKRIRINAVSPSMIETKFLSNINEKSIEISANNNPLKRNATPTDIVPVVKFLLSDEASFINGTNIPITAGEVF
jgi:3-oxoacyl-[acyl-carrier protein] reductase